MPGLYRKYYVRRSSDGSPVHGFCFVLKPGDDPAARAALRAYAMNTPNLELQTDILNWLHRFELEHGPDEGLL